MERIFLPLVQPKLRSDYWSKIETMEPFLRWKFIQVLQIDTQSLNCVLG